MKIAKSVICIFLLLLILPVSIAMAEDVKNVSVVIQSNKDHMLALAVQVFKKHEADIGYKIFVTVLDENKNKQSAVRYDYIVVLQRVGRPIDRNSKYNISVDIADNAYPDRSRDYFSSRHERYEEDFLQYLNKVAQNFIARGKKIIPCDLSAKYRKAVAIATEEKFEAIQFEVGGRI